MIVLACCGHGVERTLRDVPLLEARTGWHALRAVRQRRVFVCDGSAYFSRPGPRLVDTLEKWMRAGKLNNVAPGEPEVNERDLKSFLHAAG